MCILYHNSPYEDDTEALKRETSMSMLRVVYQAPVVSLDPLPIATLVLRLLPSGHSRTSVSAWIMMKM